MEFFWNKNGGGDRWKSDPLSPFKRDHRRLFERFGTSRERRLGLPLILWAVFGGTLGYVLVFSPVVAIQTIEVPAGRGVDATKLRSITEERLNEPIGGVFPGRNFFLFPAKEIRERLLQSDRLLSDVRVGRRFPHTLVLSFTERDRIIFYCEPGAGGEETCFILEETTGIVSAAGDDWAAENRIPAYRITARERAGIAPGDTVADPRMIALMFAFEERLERILDIECSRSATVPTRFSEEVRVRSVSGSEYLLSLQVPVDTAVATLQTVYLKDLNPADWGRIEYVDLRTGGKAFYALRGEEPGQAGNSAPTGSGGDR